MAIREDSIVRTINKSFKNHISSFYVIDKDGDLMYVFSSDSQNSEKINQDLLFKLITTMHSISLETWEENLINVSLGKKINFISTDNITGTFFILSCDVEARFKHVVPILKKLKNSYLTYFTGIKFMNETTKFEANIAFQDSLDNILIEPIKTIKFLNAL